MTKPRIGLALGGGVARGWTHIGILRTLIKAGYEPDVVAGASIGAVVGGLYVAGQLDGLETWVRGLTRRRILGYLDFAWGRGGLISGDKLAKLMDDYIGGVCVENLGRQFIAVATELKTGHETWLRFGGLTESIRASYALPGVFPPVKVDGRWLVDGALVNPCPISVARAFGGRLVIGVSLHSDSKPPQNDTAGEKLVEEAEKENESLIERYRPDRIVMRQIFGPGKSDIPGLSTVMLGALNILMERLSRSRLAGDPPDVLIEPPVGDIGMLDFERGDELIAIGARAAEEALPRIAEMARILS